MPTPEKDEIQTAAAQFGRLLANWPASNPRERKLFAAEIIEQGKHLREIEAARLKAAMRDRSNLNIVLIAVLCVTLVICSVLLLCFNDPLKTQGAFTLMGAIISGWFSYLAGKRAG